MKCPKCDYTSFDHLDKCSKCGFDLTGLRDRFGFSAETGEGLDILNYMSSDDESPPTDQPSFDYKEEEITPCKDEEAESPEEEVSPDKVSLDDHPADTETEQNIIAEDVEIPPADTAEPAVQDGFNLADFTFTPPSLEPLLKENEVELSLDTVQGLELDNVDYPDLLSGSNSGLEMKIDDLPALNDSDEINLTLDDENMFKQEDLGDNSHENSPAANFDSDDISLDEIDNLSLDNGEISLDDIDIVPPK